MDRLYRTRDRKLAFHQTQLQIFLFTPRLDIFILETATTVSILTQIYWTRDKGDGDTQQMKKIDNVR